MNSDDESKEVSNEDSPTKSSADADADADADDDAGADDGAVSGDTAAGGGADLSIPATAKRCVLVFSTCCTCETRGHS